MRLGMAAWGLRKTPLTEQLALARRLDIDIIELGIANSPYDILQAEANSTLIESVRESFARTGKPLICAATGNDFALPDSAASRASAQTTEAVLKIAGQLKIRYLRIFAGFIPVSEFTAERRAMFHECMSRCMEAANANGVTPVLETHGGVQTTAGGVIHTPSIATEPEMLHDFLIKYPGLMLCFDPANLYAAGKDPVKFYRDFRPWIPVMHLKDFAPAPDGSLIPGACGDGGLVWPELLAEIANFSGPALIEYENTADVESGMARSLEFLQSALLEKAL